MDLYKDRTAAGKPDKLHLFAQGGPGFGMNPRNNPTDGWIERFDDRLDFQVLLD